MRTVTDHGITAQCDTRGLDVTYAPTSGGLCTHGHGAPATTRVTVHCGPLLVATVAMCDDCATSTRWAIAQQDARLAAA